MYNVNLRRFANSLLPPVLRGDVKELLQVLMHPVKALLSRFADVRRDGVARLEYNGCVGSMQVLLNARFATLLESVVPVRPIVIEDGEAVPAILVYPAAVYEPVMVGNVLIRSHYEWSFAPFLVKIPQEFQSNVNFRNEVEAAVQQYKFAGTQYIITYY